MQTFLPYPDMQRSLECLDVKRLGKQRLETAQILRKLIKPQTTLYAEYDKIVNLDSLDIVTKGGKGTGWTNHTAVLPWVGYEGALAVYHDVSLMVWMERGYNNSMPFVSRPGGHLLPPWWGDERYHSSHRSNLLRKDAEWYGQFGWTDDPNAEYFWPSRNGY